jgi:hypothetical protein
MMMRGNLLATRSAVANRMLVPSMAYTRISRTPARRNVRRRGAVLLLVIAYIAVAFGLLTLLGVSGMHLMRMARQEREAATVRQMLDSGLAWARSHRDNPPVEGVVTLDADRLTGPEARGSITVTFAPDDKPSSVRVTAHLQHHGRTRGRSVTFSLH